VRDVSFNRLDAMPEPTGRMTVTSAAPALLRKAGTSGCFVLVKPAGTRAPYPSALVELVEEAVGAANAAVTPNTTFGGFTSATPKGIAVATLSNRSVEDAGVVWCSALAAELERRGIVGTIGTTGRSWPTSDPIIHANVDRRFPATFVAYRVTDYPLRTLPLNGWRVEAATAARLTRRLQDWVAASGDEVWVNLVYGAIPVPPSEAARFLDWSTAHSSTLKRLTSVDVGSTTSRSAVLSDLGGLVTQHVDPEADWLTLLAAQIDLLLLDPLAADAALIKNSGCFPMTWSNLDIRGDSPHRTVRHPIDYECNRHLWDQYVIDAAGVNLLTGKHLEHAHDLGDWEVEEVAPERYLVKAKDLGAWYAGMAADPATIAKARDDFGDMILSWDAILANPGPYSVTEGIIVGR